MHIKLGIPTFQVSQLVIYFLFPLFFVLHGYNENFDVIGWRLVIELLVRYFVIATVILFFSILAFKESTKVFILAFFGLSLFFFFGSFHHFLKINFKNQRLSSYSVLLPLLFIVLIAATIILRKSKNTYTRLASYIKLLILLLLATEIVVLSYKSLRPKNLVGSLTSLPVVNERLKTQFVNQPDVFLIVFDGYTSSRCLKKEFGFDNSSLDSLLTSHKFFVSWSSKSNYNLTPFSIASVLNAAYLKVDSQEYVISQKDLLSGVNTVKSNWIIPFFRKNGYDVKNFGVFDFETLKTTSYTYFGDDYYLAAIDDQTLSSRIGRDIGWNFKLKNFFTGEFRIPQSYFRKKEKYIDRDRHNYEQLINELQIQTDIPRFIYCHVMLPHEPYYFNANGTIVSDTAILLGKINEKSGYINQIQYCNRLLGKIIELSSTSSNRKKVVILMGDHGYRSYPSKKYRQKTFMNLNCIYSSDGTQGLYDGISPVNSFRFVLNKYFGQALPFLKDSSIYLVDPKYDIK